VYGGGKRFCSGLLAALSDAASCVLALKRSEPLGVEDLHWVPGNRRGGLHCQSRHGARSGVSLWVLSYQTSQLQINLASGYQGWDECWPWAHGEEITQRLENWGVYGLAFRRTCGALWRGGSRLRWPSS